MDYVSGEIFTVNGFKGGYLGFEKDKIVESGSGYPPKKPVCKGLIVPSFINAHTHIGDSFIRDKNIKLPKDIEKLVAPPYGLKHKLLKEVSDEDVIKGMEESVDTMIKAGTKCFCDFRENGILGISQLKSALKLWNISSVILSRPDTLTYDRDEVDLLLKNSEGIGLSSISDWDYSEMKKIARHTKKKNKIFAFHASERIREEIDLILDLKPDFLVHMVKAEESDLIRVKECNIPIVLCPRSNSFFGLKPDMELLKKIGIELLLGTDNAMLSSLDILDELRYVKDVAPVFSVDELLNMITYTARKALNLSPSILGSSSPADFVVLDKKTLKTLYISCGK